MPQGRSPIRFVRRACLWALAGSLAWATPGLAAQELTELELAQLEARYLDQVLVVAGDQVITDQQLARQFQAPHIRERIQELRQLPPEQQAQELGLLQRDAVAELVEIFLATQAGQDRGFDPKLVETLVERRFRERAKQAGGYQIFSTQLKASGLTPELFKDQIRQQLYRFAWQGAVTGRQPGVTGRMEMDRYVRPGALRKAYRNFRQSPSVYERNLVGETEARYELKELALGFEALGSRETALERSAAIRAEIVAGRMTVQDFINRWKLSDPDAERKASVTLTDSQAVQVSQQTFGSGRFLEFLRQAEIGDLSEPFESNRAAHLFYVEEVHDPQKAPPFQTFQLQEDLRNHLLARQESKRLGRAFGQLIRENRLSDPQIAEFMLSPEWLERER